MFLAMAVAIEATNTPPYICTTPPCTKKRGLSLTAIPRRWVESMLMEREAAPAPVADIVEIA